MVEHPAIRSDTLTEQTNNYNPFPAIAVWNVVFLDVPRSSWWDWFTSDGWRHCCAFGYSVTGECWVIYDVADKTSRISIVDDYWFDRWVGVRRNRITSIIQIETKEGGDERARLGLWCVTAIKHLVGLRSGALRPKALHRDLLRHGGKPAFEDIYGRQVESPSRRSRNKSASASS